MDKLLKDALVDSNDPVPGYIFAELSKLTHQDISICEKLSEALYKKLGSTEKPNLKWKCLLIMRQVCKTGRMDFRRCLQRRSQEVKTCTTFKAPQDPLRGDEPGRRVRDTAKEALEAMFDSNPPMGYGGMGGRITGSGGGSDPHAPPPASSHSSFGPSRGTGFSTALPGQAGYDPNSPMHLPPVSTGTMQGFGNFDPSKKASSGIMNSLVGGIKSAFTTATTVPSASSPSTAFANSSSSTGSGGYPIPPPQSSYTGPSSSYGASSSTGSASSFGGSFGSNSGSRAPGQPGGGWGGSQTTSGPSSGSYGRRHTDMSTVGGGASDRVYERNLVNELTAPGGLRPVPDKSKLTSFLQGLKTLDINVIAGLLDEKINLARDGSPNSLQSAQKALAVIEAIAAPGAGLTSQSKYLADNCDLLLDLLEDTSVKAPFRQAVHKTLEVLNVGVPMPEELKAAISVAPTEKQFFQYTAPAPAPVTAPAPVAAPVPAPAPVAAPTPAPAPAPVAVPTAGGFDLFAAMSAPSPAPVPAPAPVAATFDLFSSLSTPAPLPASVPAPAPAAAPMVSHAQPAASAFDGLLGGQPSPAVASPAIPSPAFPQLNPQAAQLQQMIQTITMQMSQNPSAAPALVPQLVQLQQQLVAVQSVPGAAAVPQQNFMMPQPAYGMPMSPMPMQMQMPMNQMNLMNPQLGYPMMNQGVGMSMGMNMNMQPVGGIKLASPTPAPAPAAAPRQPDLFDFASKDLFKS